MANIIMPVNPKTGLYNVTESEVEAARMHQSTLTIVTLVRPDGTLTDWGQMYVAKERRAACPHNDVRDTGTFDPDGSHITRCATCGDTWNEGVE